MISYTIQSNVIDIRKDVDIEGKSFYVDTNVWFWITSLWGYDCAAFYQNKYYPDFVNKAIEISKLYTSIINVLELSHVIEKTGYDIYKKETGSELTFKEYRHNLPEKRKETTDIIVSSWECLSGMARVLRTEVDEKYDIDQAIEILTRSQIDSYDSLIFQTMEKNDIKNVVSDDGDFATIPDVTVFTANRNVVKAAEEQGKLIE